jgi:hypothetical protein
VKVGASRSKVILLSVLGVALVYVIYSNFSSDGARPAAAPRAAIAPAQAVALPDAPAPAELRPRAASRAGESRTLRLTLKDKKADPTTVDPTIRFDLLAKVHDVKLEGGVRNLFQFGAAPLPPRPEPKIQVNAPALQAQQQALANNQPAAPPPPPPPPIPLKFYGYSSANPGLKKAFFLQGDEIVVAAEGDMVQKRYKIVRIGVNSCVVEDTEFKHQQTLQLEEVTG